MIVHLTGLGLLGSLTAWQLHHRGIPFTWDDNKTEINAWRACTGACYPASGEVDQRSYRQWRRWASGTIYPVGTLETCAYWVDTVHRSLPHGLEAPVQATAGSMRLVGDSVHVNAQALVQQTRNYFARYRTSGYPLTQPAPRHVVSHGFTHRLARYLWGWTRIITLKYDDSIGEHGRPSFYLRRNRFQFAYCYPKPGTEFWYAGSSLVSQKTAKELDPVPRYAAWKKWFLELIGGANVSISNEGQYLQGWRPAKAGSLSAEEGHKSDQGELLESCSGVLYFPTLASNGFRHYPEVWRQLAVELGLEQPLVKKGEMKTPAG